MKDLKKRKVILRFTVTDTGIGMSDEDKKLLFEMFAKVHPSNTNTYHGMGIGLYLARETIKNLDGDIEIKSKSNKGTSVRFDIPLQCPLVDDCFEDEDNKD